MSEQSKVLVPKRRFPEFESSGIWEEVSIAQLCETFSGGTPTSTEKSFYDGEIPFIRSAEIASNVTELFLTDTGLKNSSAKMVNEGDVLVALYGANSGDVAISRINGAINQAILCLQSDTESRNRFIYQYLTYKKNYIVGKYIQGGQGNLSGEIVKSIEIPQPPKISNDDLELEKIADCLSSLDDLITAQNQKVEALKQYKKGLMQQLFPAEGETVPKLRFPEFRGVKEWLDTNFYDLLDEVLDFRGRTPLKLGMNWGGGEVISLSANNVKNGFIDYKAECNLGSEDLYNQWMGKVNLEKGDIIFTMEAPLGNALLIPDSRKYILSQRVVAFKTKKHVNNAFLIQFMWSESFQSRIRQLATGSTAKGINQKTLKKVDIKIANNPDEQLKVAGCLSSLDDLIAAQNQKLDALKEHKKGLMQQLFPSLVEA